MINVLVDARASLRALASLAVSCYAMGCAGSDLGRHAYAANVARVALAGVGETMKTAKELQAADAERAAGDDAAARGEMDFAEVLRLVRRFVDTYQRLATLCAELGLQLPPIPPFIVDLVGPPRGGCQ